VREEEAALALRALRLLRRGTLQPAAAPGPLRPFLARGLGPACDDFAGWLRRSAGDPRAVEAAARFFGLDRLPEDLRKIGAALAPRHPGGRAGVGARQVERLVSRAVTDMARRGGDPAVGPVREEAPQPWRDPFPLPHERPVRRWVTQVVVWAWAQVPAGDRGAAAALLYYEHEHALRARAPMPSSRMERQRWRRLAWSVLQVASHRAALAARAGGPAGAAGRPGGLLAVTGGHGEAGGLLALTALCAGPGPRAEADLTEAALEFVRTAVREGRPEALELFWLLRGGMNGFRAAAGGAAPGLESRLITLSAIVARERRDPAGIPAALAGLRRIDALLDAPAARRDHRTWVALVEGGHRTSQELADLYASLGRFAEAQAATGQMRSRLERLGDPDPSYLPRGWHWNLLVTESSVGRHLARASASPEPGLRAATITAQRAAELRAAMELPASWAVAAENEVIAAALARLDDPAYRASRPGGRLLADVARRLDRLDTHSQQIDDHHNRDTRRALLHARLLAWRLALQQADPGAIQAAGARVRSELRSSAGPILPVEAEQVARYERAAMERLDPRRGARRR
jgi:hypothetical protein